MSETEMQISPAHEARPYKLIDLYCGMGGWSIGFYREGFDCLGVDIVDVGYPYRLVTGDIREIDYTDILRAGGKPDFVTASPPCTEFSTLTMLSYKKGQRGPPDPEAGMVLVKAAIEKINALGPRYWLIENVYGSIPYISRELGKPALVAKPWVLWGNLPSFMLPDSRGGNRRISHSSEHRDNSLGKGGNKIGLPEDFPFDPLRSWKRAKIPTFLGQTIARAAIEEMGATDRPEVANRGGVS